MEGLIVIVSGLVIFAVGALLVTRWAEKREREEQARKESSRKKKSRKH